MTSTNRDFFAAIAVTALTWMMPGVGLAGHSDTDISANLDQLPGIWASEGYGQIVVIENGSPMRFERYEVSAVHCLLFDSGPLEALQNRVSHVLRNAGSTRISYMYPGNVTTYAFNRLDTVPTLCRNGGTGTNSDPLVNFDAFWATFQEQYAFFNERGVDWNALGEELRSRLTADSSDEALFEVLSEMVIRLCDPHVEVVSPFAEFSAGVNPTCLADNHLFQEIIAEFSDQSEFEDPFEYYQRIFRPSVLQIIEESYFVGAMSSAARDKIHWGRLGDGVAYLGVLQMTNYASDEATPDEDLAVLSSVLDEALAYLSDADALVIDIRTNTGGYDHVALDLASRFADRPRVAFTKKTRWDDGYTAKQVSLLDPSREFQFSGPVVILTSTLTASAAENFLLAMKALPQVTIIGETTVGVHSDVFPRRLPNGWRFTLSNEVYQTADGTLFEGRGIEPDTEVAALRAADRSAGRDAGIEAALARLTTPTIDPGLGGVWWNPDRSGEGFMFHFFDVGESRHLFATFYTYDGNGNQAYLVGSTTDFASPVTLDVGLTEGGVFGPSYDPDDQILLPWGTLTIDFQNCRKAVVTLDSDTPGFESYSTAIERFGQAPFDQRLCNPLH